MDSTPPPDNVTDISHIFKSPPRSYGNNVMKRVKAIFGFWSINKTMTSKEPNKSDPVRIASNIMFVDLLNHLRVRDIDSVNVAEIKKIFHDMAIASDLFNDMKPKQMEEVVDTVLAYIDEHSRFAAPSL